MVSASALAPKPIKSFMLPNPHSFTWPEGKRAAISLTFDDARPSQLDYGLPVLNAYDARATFYASLPAVEKRLDDWKCAIAQGHEIGNHTLTHPCSGNFPWSRTKALKDYTLERIEQELTGANEWILEHLGVQPASFAYPCGQKYVGRGEQCRSYVPLVAKHFIAGRGFRDEAPNDPTYCDLAQLNGGDADCCSFDTLKVWLDQTASIGGWLVIAAHDVGKQQAGQTMRQTFYTDALEALCQYVHNPAYGFWIDTVATIGRYVDESRDFTL